MSRRLKQAAVVLIIVFAGAQLVRPERANPATDARRTIQAHMGTASGLVAVLDRACSLHTGASRYAALGPGRRDDLRGSAPGRSEHSRRTEGAVKR
jgi:hypothetical protein